jgi:hypothetical protein
MMRILMAIATGLLLGLLACVSWFFLLSQEKAELKESLREARAEHRHSWPLAKEARSLRDQVEEFEGEVQNFNDLQRQASNAPALAGELLALDLGRLSLDTLNVVKGRDISLKGSASCAVAEDVLERIRGEATFTDVVSKGVHDPEGEAICSLDVAFRYQQPQELAE